MSPLTNEQMASDLPAAKVSVNRLNVVGSSGGGKSTAGKLIAKKLGYPWVELDGIQRNPSWTESTEQASFANLKRSLEEKLSV